MLPLMGQAAIPWYPPRARTFDCRRTISAVVLARAVLRSRPARMERLLAPVHATTRGHVRHTVATPVPQATRVRKARTRSPWNNATTVTLSCQTKRTACPTCAALRSRLARVERLSAPAHAASRGNARHTVATPVLHAAIVRTTCTPDQSNNATTLTLSWRTKRAHGETANRRRRLSLVAESWGASGGANASSDSSLIGLPSLSTNWTLCDSLGNSRSGSSLSRTAAPS
jgi:hypothetical protein